MKEQNKLDLIRIATVLKQIDSSVKYNGEEGLALIYVNSLNNLGKKIEKIVEDEAIKKSKKKKYEKKGGKNRK